MEYIILFIKGVRQSRFSTMMLGNYNSKILSPSI